MEKNVGGGDPACGKAADAFRKSGATAGGPPVSQAVWHFRFHRAVRCTLSVYIARTDPSSGRAVYRVTANGKVATFDIAQASFKGGFSTPAALTGLSAPDGDIVLVLTDLSTLRGDTNHVTASSVSASCRPS